MMALKKISEALSSLSVSLQLSMLLPAIIFVVGILGLISPATLSNEQALPIIILATITFSYLLNACNMPLIRLFEGYIMADMPLLQNLRLHQLEKFYKHHRRIYNYRKKLTDLDIQKEKWEFAKLMSPQREQTLRQWMNSWNDLIDREQEELETRYPPVPSRVLATGLGNTIAAFEWYPKRRYSMGIGLWPRLCLSITDEKHLAYVESEKLILDFFVNLIWVMGLLWIVDFSVFAITGRPETALLLLLLPVMTYVFYRGACVAAENWGWSIKIAFDLFRSELQKTLHLHLPVDAKLADERAMWHGISTFLAYGKPQDYNGFDYNT